MSSKTFILPVDPGMTPECLKFAEEALGPRRAEHEESRRRSGITVEKVWIEATNAGDWLIIYLESADLEKSLTKMGSSDYVYDLWFHDKIFELTGADICDHRTMASEPVFTSPRLETGRPGGSAATVFSILPGKKPDWIAFLEGLSGPREEEYRAFLSRYGLTQQQYYAQTTPRGEMAILYLEGEDPAGALAEFARSNHPFDVWLREEMLLLNGTDFIRRQTAPAPRAIMDWRSKAEPLAA